MLYFSNNHRGNPQKSVQYRSVLSVVHSIVAASLFLPTRIMFPGPYIIRAAKSGTVVVILMLGACAGLPPPETPNHSVRFEPTATQEGRAAALRSQSGMRADPVPTEWWTLFGDPVLGKLMQARPDSPDLQRAALRVEESRARLGLATAARAPDVATQAGYSRQAISENSGLHQLGLPAVPYNTWTLGVAANWEVDFWGYLKAREQSARAQVDAARYEDATIQVSVTGELARVYLLLRGTQAKLRILDDNLHIAADLLRMAESRQRNGVATAYDAAAARADLSATQAHRMALVHQRDVAMNALALLLGRGPRELDAQVADAPLPTMPAHLPIGLPTDLARMRPDILAADASLRAALADKDAARADFYPRLSLTGAAGLAGYTLSDLGSWDSRNFAVGPTFYLPIFDGGRLRNTLALSDAREREAGVHYRQTVLRAWHEVDDALGAYKTELARHGRLLEARAQNRVALQVAQRAYQSGSGDFTSLLLARRTLLESDAALNDSATAGALSVVSLYRALGGGWSPTHAQAERTQ
jgi:NodT family efflux transporter outer membrane factor (OMF) lipoprotein